MKRHVERAALAKGGFMLCAAAFAICAVSGCMVGPEYTRPTITLPEGFKEESRWRLAKASTEATVHKDSGQQGGQFRSAAVLAISEPWWKSWNDPTLDQLEQRALSVNQSIAVANANYGESRALIAEARSALYPSAELHVDPSRVKYADYITTHKRFDYDTETDISAIADLQWEVDLWGKTRRGLEAANDTAEANAATLAAVKLSVSAALGEDYLLLRKSDLQLDTLRNEERSYARMVMMTRGALGHGLATDDDVLLAQNAVSDTQTRIASEESARALEEHAVAALLGIAPSQFSITPDAAYQIALPEISPVIPSALLERRPDIVNAERQAAAANARIGVAEAAYYPDLLLDASVGGENTTLAGLLSAPLRIWSLGPSFALSLFDGGRKDARVHAAQASYEGAVARYRATVINAMQEVEDDLARRREGDLITETRRQQWQRAAKLQSAQALQQRLGLVTEISLTQAEIATEDAHRLWLADVASAGLSRIALVKSIGGGWQSATSTSRAGN